MPGFEGSSQNRIWQWQSLKDKNTKITYSSNAATQGKGEVSFVLNRSILFMCLILLCVYILVCIINVFFNNQVVNSTW